MKTEVRYYRIEEASRALGMENEFVLHCISHRWIEPVPPVDVHRRNEGESESVPHLDEEDLSRLQLIRELREEFGVNDEAIPIILHLVDELVLLRKKIRQNAA